MNLNYFASNHWQMYNCDFYVINENEFKQIVTTYHMISAFKFNLRIWPLQLLLNRQHKN